MTSLPARPDRVAPSGPVVVVVAGGQGHRYTASSGTVTDKMVADLGGRGVLEHLVGTLQEQSWPLVVIGPLRAAPGLRGVVTVREDPPGAGPLAAFAAGVHAVPDSDVLVLLGGDQPFAAGAVPRLVDALLGSGPGVGAVVGVDARGRRQPLLSAHRRERVLRVLQHLPTTSNRPLRDLFTDLPGSSAGVVLEVPVADVECLDVDVPDDLERARRLLPGPEAGSDRRP